MALRGELLENPKTKVAIVTSLATVVGLGLGIESGIELEHNENSTARIAELRLHRELQTVKKHSGETAPNEPITVRLKDLNMAERNDLGIRNVAEGLPTNQKPGSLRGFVHAQEIDAPVTLPSAKNIEMSIHEQGQRASDTNLGVIAVCGVLGSGTLGILGYSIVQTAVNNRRRLIGQQIDTY
jgi:hypothetical protein